MSLFLVPGWDAEHEKCICLFEVWNHLPTEKKHFFDVMVLNIPHEGRISTDKRSNSR